MSLTNSLESVRLALFHLSKILFAQTTELVNSDMNRGLPPNLAMTDPSLNFCAKGIDIGCAAYVGELGWLANPVGTHIQSAEMHNQAVNSLALVSARATEKAVEVTAMVIASYLWALCQAADARTLLREFREGARRALRVLLQTELQVVKEEDVNKVWETLDEAIEHTSKMDAKPRMEQCSKATLVPLVQILSTTSSSLSSLPPFTNSLASALTSLLLSLQRAYLTGARGRAPASSLLGRTRAVYEFVRCDLGVPTHGRENLEEFGKRNEAWSLGKQEETVGGGVARIYEAIRAGRMETVVVGIFDHCLTEAQAPATPVEDDLKMEL